MIKTIKIVDADLVISQVGFGCARLNGGAGREYSCKLLQTAYENGIKHFDTAPMYQTEEILGEFFRGIRDVTFCSKVGIDPGPKVAEVDAFKFFYKNTLKHILSHFPGVKKKLLSITGSYKPYIVREDFKHAKLMSRDYVLRRLEDSLKKLKRSSLDIYLVHEPDLFLLGPDSIEIFEDLKSNGYIKSYGLGYSRPLTGEAGGFGSVVQSGWSPTLINNDYSCTNIYHGMLRNGGIEDILKLTRDDVHSAMIFSASTIGQIKRLTSALGKL